MYTRASKYWQSRRATSFTVTLICAAALIAAIGSCCGNEPVLINDCPDAGAQGGGGSGGAGGNNTSC